MNCEPTKPCKGRNKHRRISPFQGFSSYGSGTRGDALPRLSLAITSAPLRGLSPNLFWSDLDPAYLTLVWPRVSHPMGMRDERIHLFADFTLDLARGCLLCAGEPVHLRPQAYEALKYLAENKGRLVSKDRLIETVWQGRAVTDD